MVQLLAARPLGSSGALEQTHSPDCRSVAVGVAATVAGRRHLKRTQKQNDNERYYH